MSARGVVSCPTRLSSQDPKNREIWHAMCYTFLTLWSQLSRAWKLCRSRNVTFPPQSCVTWAQIYGGTILQVLYPTATLAQPCIFLFQCPVNAQPALTEPKFTCFVFCFLSCSCLFFSVCLFLKISCCTVFC